MESFKEFYFINEDAEEVYLPDGHPIGNSPRDTVGQKRLVYFDSDAYPFLIIDKYVFSSKASGWTHEDIISSIQNLNEPYTKTVTVYPQISDNEFKLLFDTKIYPNSEDEDEVPARPKDFVNMSGRLWKKSNIVSFWEEKHVVMKHIKTIFNFIKHIGGDPTKYKYQFADSDDLIPYNKLDAKFVSTISKDEIAARRAQHIKSPLKKKAKKPTYNKGLSVPGMPGKKKWAISSESAEV